MPRKPQQDPRENDDPREHDEREKPETTPHPTAEAVSDAVQQRQPIRLCRIVWKKPVEFSGPSSSQGSVREFLSGTGRRQYVLEWYPWLRHFRVLDVTRKDLPLDVAETWIHESNATSWRRSFAKD